MVLLSTSTISHYLSNYSIFSSLSISLMKQKIGYIPIFLSPKTIKLHPFLLILSYSNLDLFELIILVFGIIIRLNLKIHYLK
jgi:hypothetical protein